MTNTIEAGQTLSTRSLCDYDVVFTVEILDRKKSFATVKDGGTVKRCKVYEYNGDEYVMPFGKYSMAPCFYASDAV